MNNSVFENNGNIINLCCQEVIDYYKNSMRQIVYIDYSRKKLANSLIFLLKYQSYNRNFRNMWLLI